MKTPQQTPPNVSERNERLKAALQANIARRKAQTRARDNQAGDAGTKEQNPAGSQVPEQE